VDDAAATRLIYEPWRLEVMADRRDYAASLGTAIEALRERRGLSAQTLAERAGLSSSWLVDVEAGRGDPTWGDLRRISDAMDVPLPELMEQVERVEGEQAP
jgi:XRE family transcriptional regulator, aerobic/anaerobic benzoate catabolism transcriptional regulator